ncbi:tyrosine--tRNA ligase [endosymbiont of Pachyrhynchus infernalis]|uniref:tyrosine--tRNA ligase n=1 Tax=endosymbiont of Pachyrhynchus infernalis TaxID=1971488 RepID=UPI000DC73A06|nr:tyrosine--tRNA ligase [endosymbiont of Pachyrhynchus infernalis]BBA84813.1 tyrosine--tRNA ligase [endosymbiont of Pachyrhynchus infernalis]
MKNKILTHLYSRNLIKKIVNENKLNNLLNENKIVLYSGIDPTSDSLHIGHIILIIFINKFIELNNKFIILIGGSTGLIGDPNFTGNKRNKYTEIFINKNSIEISKQLKNILLNNINYNNINILNNKHWLSKINIIDFLYNIGSKFSIKNILNRKYIKNNIIHNKISYSELTYTLLQSYDFLYLYNNYNTKLQIGGSDQWNNIIYGINLIKKIHNKDTYGITFPIITNNNGIKFSKSSKENIWLDDKKTSPYKFYQFWINLSDNLIFKYLKMFTNESLEYIEYLEKNNIYNNILKAKKLLAEKMTEMIHGKKKLKSAIKITNSLFTGNLNFNEKDLKQLYTDGIPIINVKLGINLQQIIVQFSIVKSNNEAKNIILSNSIKINGIVNNTIKYIFTKKDILYDKYTLLCKGKKNYYLIVWE